MKIEKKIMNKMFSILQEKKIDLTKACELKIYAIARTALELNIPKDIVENTVEMYRRGKL